MYVTTHGRGTLHTGLSFWDIISYGEEAIYFLVKKKRDWLIAAFDRIGFKDVHHVFSDRAVHF